MVLQYVLVLGLSTAIQVQYTDSLACTNCAVVALKQIDAARVVGRNE
jgi:hypothetical protein